MKKIIKRIITGIRNLLCLSIHIQLKANRKSDFFGRSFRILTFFKKRKRS